MTDQPKFGRHVLSSGLVIAALTVGIVVASDAQAIQQPYRAPSPTPAEQQGLRNLPPAMRDSVAESLASCGGDFGMLGNLEAARHGVSQANPTDGPVCD